MDKKITDIVKHNLETKFNETIKLLNGKNFSITKNDFSLPTISYELKGKTAGRAYLQKNLIKLNKDIISNPKYFNEMSEDTLYHELAHLFIFFLYKTGRLDRSNFLTNKQQKPKPHGIEWKKLMILMGQNPNVTHNFEVTSVRKTLRITYLCDCREHEMTKMAYNKMKRGSKYTCKKCKGFLQIKPGAVFKNI